MMAKGEMFDVLTVEYDCFCLTGGLDCFYMWQ